MNNDVWEKEMAKLLNWIFFHSFDIDDFFFFSIFLSKDDLIKLFHFGGSTFQPYVEDIDIIFFWRSNQIDI